MLLRKFLRFPLFFLIFSVFFSACQRGDSRVLGSIGDKTYTVETLLSLFLDPKERKENRKSINDETLMNAFKTLANFTVFAGEADKTQFFEQNPTIKAKLDTETKKLYRSAYQKYIYDKILEPMLQKIALDDKDLAPYKKRVQVRHILLSKDGSMKDPVKGKQLEETILKELSKGTSFEDLAKKYSEDPGSKDSGGLIPEWIYTNSPLVPEFVQAALSAKKSHEIIPDVNTTFGTHIIYIDNLQDRSASEIKDNDPQLYNQILDEKKNAQVGELMEKILKDFPIEVNKDVNFKNYFDSYSKATENKTLYTIAGKTVYTGKNFMDDVVGGDIARFKMALKQNPTMDIASTVKMLGVMPLVEEMYAKKENFDSKPDFQETLSFRLTAVKATLYLQDFVVKQGPKKETMPTFQVSADEVQKFYDKNKDMYTKAPKKGEKSEIMPLTDELKKDIQNRLIMEKQQQFQQEQSLKLTDFIQKEGEKHYGDYKIVLNQDFLKDSEKDKTKEADKK